ncbi:Ber1 protein [Saccharomycopsis crataegensis]|uniref:Ber1 protein n=1 Tax=Saccharomycopsis crataegensis TaxID=43959 RepID=A0AAV5QUJ1_9ASCO|nr:Ber1 protein [Saccharomycopsis crataegensis]
MARKITTFQDRTILNEENLKFLKENIDAKKSTLSFSELWKQISNNLTTILVPEDVDIQIRSLALGSMSSEISPKFQMALLLLIKEQLNVKRISLYDPEFNDLDRELMTKEYDMTVDEIDPFSKENNENVIYYLPHIPLEVLEGLIAEKHPSYMICNNIEKHLSRFTVNEIITKFPELSLVYFKLEPDVNDEFTVVEKKKPRNRKKKGQSQRLAQVMEDEKTQKQRFLDSVKEIYKEIDVMYKIEASDVPAEAGNSFSDLFLLKCRQ